MSKFPADRGDPSRKSSSKNRSGVPQSISADHTEAADTLEANAQRWRELFQQTEPGLRAFLSGKLPQVADVDDCLQSVMVAMLKNKTEIPHAARRAWLFRVAANESAKWWRQKSTTDRVLEKHAATNPYTVESNTLPAIENEEIILQVNQAIETLPENVRRIVRMRIADSMTFQAIADELDVPLGTVLTQMRRAMQRLRNELSPDPPK